jgi:sugar phosphate isomerase/epimerase
MISVQLWSVRDELSELGPEVVLPRLAGAGFEHVEPFAVADTLGMLRSICTDLGLTTPTAHGDLTGDNLSRTLDAAAELGAGTVVHPMFPAERWMDAHGVRGVADDLNRAAAAAASYGLRVAFHNHDDEIRTEIDGRPALIDLFDQVGPQVGVELDSYWPVVAGADPVALARQLGPHIFGAHLKDGPSSGVNSDQLPLGEGVLDTRAFISALPPDVPRVISLDMFPGDSLAAVLTSKKWLDARGIS